MPVHLCRLQYFGDEQRWGVGLFAYSSEKYELSVFPSGQFFRPPEDAFEISANVYLRVSSDRRVSSSEDGSRLVWLE
jgi:hypothetical protein